MDLIIICGNSVLAIYQCCAELCIMLFGTAVAVQKSHEGIEALLE